MAHWSAPTRPALHAEHALIRAILDGHFPPGSVLPGERDLAAQLGVTRPTLREALQRLARDGWLTIQQGKATMVNDFWCQGGLNVLGALVQHEDHLPSDFIPNLLEVRLHLAPAYTRAGIEQGADLVIALLGKSVDLEDSPSAFAAFDWELHHGLTIASGNPVYTLILNGFAGFYEAMACRYFAVPQARAVSRAFYSSLLEAARARDAGAAEQLTRQVMRDSISLWRRSQELAQV